MLALFIQTMFTASILARTWRSFSFLYAFFRSLEVTVVIQKLRYLDQYLLLLINLISHELFLDSIGEESIQYFPTNYSLIGQAEGIDDVADAAFDHNVSFGRFVTIAKQKGDDRVDMLAYDYDSKEVISIEIESKSEQSSHPEQVKYNDEKWIKMGFDSCQIWSKSKQIRNYVSNCDVFVVD